MATFLAHIRVHPGMESEFERIGRELWASTHQHEPAARRYEYFRGAELGTYYTLASFDDYEGFIAHQVSDHHIGATPALRATIAEMHLEWLDPVGDASDLARTEMIEPTASASDLAKSYAERQPAIVQPWWRPQR
jgi:quinol monooxygenase YgiN